MATYIIIVGIGVFIAMIAFICRFMTVATKPKYTFPGRSRKGTTE